MERVVILIDMDCFYVQVEQRLQPQHKGKPCAVVQYNDYRGGYILAVGYEARALGVKRGGGMRGDYAKKACPDIHLFRVPEERGKGNLTRYREAGAEVIETLCKFGHHVERASVDEAYIDVTEEVEKRLQRMERITADEIPNTHVVGFDNVVGKDDNVDARQESLTFWLNSIYDCEDINIYDQRLAVGAILAEEMRLAVFEETDFLCSAGIGHNKMLAKLACGLHKPNQQTVLPQSSVPNLFKTIPISKIRGFGGKLGKELSEKHGMENMADLCYLSEQQLKTSFGDKTGECKFHCPTPFRPDNFGPGPCCHQPVFSYQIAEIGGFDYEPVTARQLPKSIGCSKRFPGPKCLDTTEKVKNCVKNMSEELEERLIKDRELNKRIAKSLSVNAKYNENTTVISKTCALVKYKAEKIASDAFTLLQKTNLSGSHKTSWSPAIISLAISAGKFEDEEKGSSKITTLFKKTAKTSTQPHSDVSVKTDSKMNVRDTSLFPQRINSQSILKSHLEQEEFEKNSCSQMLDFFDTEKNVNIEDSKQLDRDLNISCQKKQTDHRNETNPSFDNSLYPPVSTSSDTRCTSECCLQKNSIETSDSHHLVSKEITADNLTLPSIKRKGFFAMKQHLMNFKSSSPVKQGNIYGSQSSPEEKLFSTSTAVSVDCVKDTPHTENVSHYVCTPTTKKERWDCEADTSDCPSRNILDGCPFSSTPPEKSVSPCREPILKTEVVSSHGILKIQYSENTQDAMESYQTSKQHSEQRNDEFIKTVGKFDETGSHHLHTNDCSVDIISSFVDRNTDSDILSVFVDTNTDKIPESSLTTEKCNEHEKDSLDEGEQQQLLDRKLALEIQKQEMYRTVDHHKHKDKSAQNISLCSKSAEHKSAGPVKRKSSSQLTGFNKKIKPSQGQTLYSFFTQNKHECNNPDKEQ